MTEPTPPISATVDDQILVRGLDLAGEMIGELTFTAALLLDIDGHLPSPERVRVVDAVLVALMEHGITPSTLATRLILDGAPESLQGAVAGGLLATGDRFLGTVAQTADAAQRVVTRGGHLPDAAAAVVDELLAGLAWCPASATTSTQTSTRACSACWPSRVTPGWRARTATPSSPCLTRSALSPLGQLLHPTPPYRYLNLHYN